MYESFCDICNTKEDVKNKEDKLERFKKEVGVYIGESGRSIYEVLENTVKMLCTRRRTLTWSSIGRSAILSWRSRQVSP